MKLKKTFIFIIVAFLCLFVSCTENIEPAPELLGIELLNTENIEIYLNSVYNPKDVKVMAIYDNETKSDVTRFSSFSNPDTSSLGEKEIRVTYESFLESYKIQVVPQPPQKNYELKIGTMPNKLVYQLNETLELEGLSLKVYLNGLFFSNLDLNSSKVTLKRGGRTVIYLDVIGDYEVILSTDFYEVPLSVSYFIEVIQQTVSHDEEFIIYHQASKLSYNIGDELDTSGLTVGLSDGKNFTVISLDLCTITLWYGGIEKTALDVDGIYEVKIVFSDQLCSYFIEVGTREPVRVLELNYENAKIQYQLGEAYTSSGLEIRYYEDDVLKRIVSPTNCQFKFTVHGMYKESLDEAGTYTVIVEFEGLQAEYRIVVLQKRGIR